MPKLNFKHYGQGFPLIILHGLYGSSSNWRSIAKTLASRYSVYCLDARNHGDSDWTQSMHYTEMADDVVAFMQTKKIEKAHILGHSMGGKTAMMLALQHPEKVAQLIVVDIAPVEYTHHENHRLYIDTMRSMDLNSLGNERKQAHQRLTKTLNQPQIIIHFLLKNLIFINQKFKWRINLEVLADQLSHIMDFDLSTIHSPCTIPSLFIYGENSDYVQNTQQKVIGELFPNSQLKAIKNAGHWLHVEQPVAFVQAVVAFLSRPSPTD